MGVDFGKRGLLGVGVPQAMMGGAFLALGGLCVVAPKQVIRHGFTPQFRGETDPTKPVEPQGISVLCTQCFGAQAMLAGVLLSTARMDRRSYLVWGAAMLPFIWFDIEYYRRGALTRLGAIGDGVGNAFFILCSLWGSGVLADAFARR